MEQLNMVIPLSAYKDSKWIMILKNLLHRTGLLDYFETLRFHEHKHENSHKRVSKSLLHFKSNAMAEVVSLLTLPLP
jgi:NADPH-dependent 7-cyano-7-deazaguanine reductase QueF